MQKKAQHDCIPTVRIITAMLELVTSDSVGCSLSGGITSAFCSVPNVNFDFLQLLQNDLRHPDVRRAIRHWTGNERLSQDEADELMEDNYRSVFSPCQAALLLDLVDTRSNSPVEHMNSTRILGACNRFSTCRGDRGCRTVAGGNALRDCPCATGILSRPAGGNPLETVRVPPGFVPSAGRFSRRLALKGSGICSACVVVNSKCLVVVNPVGYGGRVWCHSVL